MAKVPTQVVIAAYHDEAAADEVADALKKAKRRLQIYYRNVAVIRKDAKGKVKIKETGDMSGGVGAGVGAVVGGALGILAGPAGLAAGAAAGAVIGGAGAALHDAGIPNERLEQIGSVLQPGNSAVIAIFQEARVDKATMKEVDKGAAEAVYTLSTDIGNTLRSGQDVAYAFAVTEEGVVAERMASGEDAADIQALVVTEEGVAAGAAVATEEGVVYEAAVATEEGAAYETGVVTEEGAVVAGVAATEDEAVAGAAVLTPTEESGDAEEEKKEE
ncbi:MAG: hypothetical protein AMJ56_07980 [Anaerolineae bacterium SG8_19]|jgi:uncharacterized membrane protein|nr:MAG: hypothetical protein AMJ56_07980 [Anaerolineae bacterium SG8_19]